MKRNKNTLARKIAGGGTPTHQKYDENGLKKVAGPSSPFNPDKRAYHSANQGKRHSKDMTRFCPDCGEILFNNVTICHQCGKELVV